LATSAELRTLAQQRIREAEVLINYEHYEGGYYLSGYAIEFSLKAIICKRLNIEIFDGRHVPDAISKAFKVHDLKHLIILSGLQKDLENSMASDTDFSFAWSIVSGWNEQRRYETGCSHKTAETFVNEAKLLLKWTQQHW
jgi:HEPN domain-containing protein